MSTYTKSNLIAELASEAGISRRKAQRLLDVLAEVAYRQTKLGGFTVPGLCRLDVVRRKERRARNPRTGDILLIAEHDVLRVRHLKKARDQVTPPPPGLVTILPPETASDPVVAPATPPAWQPLMDSASAAVPPVAPVAAAAATPPSAWQPLMEAPSAPVAPAPVVAPAAAPAPATPERLISFRCKNPECRQEIEAPDDMAGTASECPSCGAPFEVPYFSEPGTLHGPAVPTNMTPLDNSPTMGRTIRIELPDDDPFE